MPAAQKTWTPAKLQIIAPSNGGAETVLWDFDFPYNPKDFAITRAAKWNEKSNKKGTLPAEYNGPVAATVTVEIFLDETTDPKGEKDPLWGDISRHIKKLLGYVNPEADSKSKDKPSAPHCKFIWGKAIEFKGYIQQVAVKYTLFRSDGTPVRGSATLTLKEFGAPEKGTNPTSGGAPGSMAHKVVAGDTLASIAYSAYGSAAGWRIIADANPIITDPLRLSPGMTLVLPPG